MFGPNLQELETRVANLERELSYRERWRGTYTPGLTYVPQDVVWYRDTIYIALKQNFNVSPGSDSSVWFALSYAVGGAPVNYAYNGEFDAVGYTGTITASTSYSSVVAGWGHAKLTGGDTCFLNLLDAGDDAVGGSRFSLQMQRTVGVGDYTLYQWPIQRVLNALSVRTFTISARVWCTLAGIASIRYYNGAAWSNGAPNTVANEWTTISMTVPAVSVLGTVAWGVLFGGGVTGHSVYVDNFSVVEGGNPVSRSPFWHPTNAGNISAGAQASQAPKCIKSIPDGSFQTVPNGGILVAFNANEIDTDFMGLTNGRITIQTPGRYFVGWELFSDTSSAATGWFSTLARSGASFWRGVTRAQAYWGAYQPGVPYVSTGGAAVEDLIAGDFLEVYAYSGSAATVRIHYNDTYFMAARIMD